MKQEPGTGPLTFIVKSDEPSADSCVECKYRRVFKHVSDACDAFGGRYCYQVRDPLLAKGRWRCPGFTRKESVDQDAMQGDAKLAVRRYGWLRRLLNWIWVMP